MFGELFTESPDLRSTFAIGVVLKPLTAREGHPVEPDDDLVGPYASRVADQGVALPLHCGQDVGVGHLPSFLSVSWRRVGNLEG